VSSPVDWALVIIGQVLVAIGIFCDLAAAILMLRLPNFFTRLHALTVGSVGGAFVPLIGAALIAAGCDFLGPYRWFMTGGAVVTAIVEYVLAGAGTHAIARAVYRARAAPLKPIVVDRIAEDREGGESAGS